MARGEFSFSVKWQCAPRGPERRAGFFFEQVRAPVARGCFFFFELVLALVARGSFLFRSNGFALRAGQRQGGVFRIPPPYLWTPLSPQRVKGCSPLTIPKMRSKPKNASRFAKRIFLCFSHLRLRRRFHLSAGLYALRGPNTSCEAANRRNEKKALSAATSFFPFRQPLRGLKGASSPFLATATTAACGGNREELLGPRSAGHECRPRHEVDAGYRNPSDPARRNRWCFSGSLLARKRELSLTATAL